MLVGRSYRNGYSPFLVIISPYITTYYALRQNKHKKKEDEKEAALIPSSFSSSFFFALQLFQYNFPSMHCNAVICFVT